MHEPVAIAFWWLRLFLAYLTPLPDILFGRVEVSTVVTSVVKLKECVYLFYHGLDPYDGSVCHQAPLLIPVFNALSGAWLPLVFAVLDFMNAQMLKEIVAYKNSLLQNEVWIKPTPVDAKGAKDTGIETMDVDAKALEKESKKGSLKSSISPGLIEILYLANPFTILACVGQSTSVLTNTAVLGSLMFATQGKLYGCTFLLAVAAYIGLYPIAFLPPLLLILANDPAKFNSVLRKGVASFIFYMALLMVLSYQLTASWQFLNSTYGVHITLPNMTPNIGLFWYFAIEVFESFRLFFMCLFQVLIFIFVIPITLRFKKHPLFAVYILATLLAILKPIPSVADAGLSLTFLFLHPEVLKYAGNTFILTSVILYASVLGPLFFNLWIYSSAGNANFFYAITLLWGLSHVMLLMDVVSGFIRREFERVYPGWRISKVEAAML